MLTDPSLFFDLGPEFDDRCSASCRTHDFGHLRSAANDHCRHLKVCASTTLVESAVWLRIAAAGLSGVARGPPCVTRINLFHGSCPPYKVQYFQSRDAGFRWRRKSLLVARRCNCAPASTGLEIAATACGNKCWRRRRRGVYY